MNPTLTKHGTLYKLNGVAFRFSVQTVRVGWVAVPYAILDCSTDLWYRIGYKDSGLDKLDPWQWATLYDPKGAFVSAMFSILSGIQDRNEKAKIKASQN